MSLIFININLNNILLAVVPSGGLNAAEWIAIIAVFISIFLPLIALVFRSGRLFERLDFIKDSINELKPDVKEIPIINAKVNILWTDRFTESKSPMILNEKGEKILKDSKIEELTNKYFIQILDQIKQRNPQNAYQAQEILIEVVRNFKDTPECKNKLEEAAFITGVDIDSVLLVAAVNIRDKIIKDLNFERDDIDKYAPKNK